MGEENPETGSNQFASDIGSPESDLLESPIQPYRRGLHTYDRPGVDAAAMHHRIARANAARAFRFDYLYGASPLDFESHEEKVCIWSGNSYSWKDMSSGIMWVAVHGMDSICVVTSNNDVDTTRVGDLWKYITVGEILCLFLSTVVSEIEDLADPSSELRKRFVHLSIEKPFSVVSVIPYTNEVDEESAQKYPIVVEYYDKKKAVEFLEEKMRSRDSISTTFKTIQTAISALQRLCIRELKADEIQCGFVEDREIEFLEVSDVEKHLAVIKAQGSGGSTITDESIN